MCSMKRSRREEGEEGEEGTEKESIGDEKEEERKQTSRTKIERKEEEKIKRYFEKNVKRKKKIRDGMKSFVLHGCTCLTQALHGWKSSSSSSFLFDPTTPPYLHLYTASLSPSSFSFESSSSSLLPLSIALHVVTAAATLPARVSPFRREEEQREPSSLAFYSLPSSLLSNDCEKRACRHLSSSSVSGPSSSSSSPPSSLHPLNGTEREEACEIEAQPFSRSVTNVQGVRKEVEEGEKGRDTQDHDGNEDDNDECVCLLSQFLSTKEEKNKKRHNKEMIVFEKDYEGGQEGVGNEERRKTDQHKFEETETQRRSSTFSSSFSGPWAHATVLPCIPFLRVCIHRLVESLLSSSPSSFSPFLLSHSSASHSLAHLSSSLCVVPTSSPLSSSPVFSPSSSLARMGDGEMKKRKRHLSQAAERAFRRSLLFTPSSLDFATENSMTKRMKKTEVDQGCKTNERGTEDEEEEGDCLNERHRVRGRREDEEDKGVYMILEKNDTLRRREKGRSSSVVFDLPSYSPLMRTDRVILRNLYEALFNTVPQHTHFSFPSSSSSSSLNHFSTSPAMAIGRTLVATSSGVSPSLHSSSMSIFPSLSSQRGSPSTSSPSSLSSLPLSSKKGETHANEERETDGRDSLSFSLEVKSPSNQWEWMRGSCYASLFLMLLWREICTDRNVFLGEGGVSFFPHPKSTSSQRNNFHFSPSPFLLNSSPQDQVDESTEERYHLSSSPLYHIIDSSSSSSCDLNTSSSSPTKDRPATTTIPLSLSTSSSSFSFTRGHPSSESSPTREEKPSQSSLLQEALGIDRKEINLSSSWTSKESSSSSLTSLSQISTSIPSKDGVSMTPTFSSAVCTEEEILSDVSLCSDRVIRREERERDEHPAKDSQHTSFERSSPCRQKEDVGGFLERRREEKTVKKERRKNDVEEGVSPSRGELTTLHAEELFVYRLELMRGLLICLSLPLYPIFPSLSSSSSSSTLSYFLPSFRSPQRARRPHKQKDRRGKTTPKEEVASILSTFSSSSSFHRTSLSSVRPHQETLPASISTGCLKERQSMLRREKRQHRHRHGGGVFREDKKIERRERRKEMKERKRKRRRRRRIEGEEEHSREVDRNSPTVQRHHLLPPLPLFLVRLCRLLSFRFLALFMEDKEREAFFSLLRSTATVACEEEKRRRKDRERKEEEEVEEDRSPSFSSSYSRRLQNTKERAMFSTKGILDEKGSERETWDRKKRKDEGRKIRRREGEHIRSLERMSFTSLVREEKMRRRERNDKKRRSSLSSSSTSSCREKRGEISSNNEEEEEEEKEARSEERREEKESEKTDRDQGQEEEGGKKSPQFYYDDRNKTSLSTFPSYLLSDEDLQRCLRLKKDKRKDFSLIVQDQHSLAEGENPHSSSSSSSSSSFHLSLERDDVTRRKDYEEEEGEKDQKEEEAERATNVEERKLRDLEELMRKKKGKEEAFLQEKKKEDDDEARREARNHQRESSRDSSSSSCRGSSREKKGICNDLKRERRRRKRYLEQSRKRDDKRAAYCYSSPKSSGKSLLERYLHSFRFFSWPSSKSNGEENEGKIRSFFSPFVWSGDFPSSSSSPSHSLSQRFSPSKISSVCTPHAKSNCREDPLSPYHHPRLLALNTPCLSSSFPFSLSGFLSSPSSSSLRATPFQMKFLSHHPLHQRQHYFSPGCLSHPDKEEEKGENLVYCQDHPSLHLHSLLNPMKTRESIHLSRCTFLFSNLYEATDPSSPSFFSSSSSFLHRNLYDKMAGENLGRHRRRVDEDVPGDGRRDRDLFLPTREGSICDMKRNGDMKKKILKPLEKTSLAYLFYSFNLAFDLIEVLCCQGGRTLERREEDEEDRDEGTRVKHRLFSSTSSSRVSGQGRKISSSSFSSSLSSSSSLCLSLIDRFVDESLFFLLPGGKRENLLGGSLSHSHYSPLSSSWRSKERQQTRCQRKEDRGEENEEEEEEEKKEEERLYGPRRRDRDVTESSGSSGSTSNSEEEFCRKDHRLVHASKEEDKRKRFSYQEMKERGERMKEKLKRKKEKERQRTRRYERSNEKSSLSSPIPPRGRSSTSTLEEKNILRNEGEREGDEEGNLTRRKEEEEKKKKKKTDFDEGKASDETKKKKREEEREEEDDSHKQQGEKKNGDAEEEDISSSDEENTMKEPERKKRKLIEEQRSLSNASSHSSSLSKPISLDSAQKNRLLSNSFHIDCLQPSPLSFSSSMAVRERRNSSTMSKKNASPSSSFSTSRLHSSFSSSVERDRDDSRVRKERKHRKKRSEEDIHPLSSFSRESSLIQPKRGEGHRLRGRPSSPSSSSTASSLSSSSFSSSSSSDLSSSSSCDPVRSSSPSPSRRRRGRLAMRESSVIGSNERCTFPSLGLSRLLHPLFPYVILRLLQMKLSALSPSDLPIFFSRLAARLVLWPASSIFRKLELSEERRKRFSHASTTYSSPAIPSSLLHPLSSSSFSFSSARISSTPSLHEWGRKGGCKSTGYSNRDRREEEERRTRVWREEQHKEREEKRGEGRLLPCQIGIMIYSACTDVLHDHLRRLSTLYEEEEQPSQQSIPLERSHATLLTSRHLQRKKMNDDSSQDIPKKGSSQDTFNHKTPLVIPSPSEIPPSLFSSSSPLASSSFLKPQTSDWDTGRSTSSSPLLTDERRREPPSLLLSIAGLSFLREQEEKEMKKSLSILVDIFSSLKLLTWGVMECWDELIHPLLSSSSSSLSSSSFPSLSSSSFPFCCSFSPFCEREVSPSLLHSPYLHDLRLKDGGRSSPRKEESVSSLHSLSQSREISRDEVTREEDEKKRMEKEQNEEDREKKEKKREEEEEEKKKINKTSCLLSRSKISSPSTESLLPPSSSISSSGMSYADPVTRHRHLFDEVKKEKERSAFSSTDTMIEDVGIGLLGGFKNLAVSIHSMAVILVKIFSKEEKVMKNEIEKSIDFSSNMCIYVSHQISLRHEKDARSILKEEKERSRGEEENLLSSPCALSVGEEEKRIHGDNTPHANRRIEKKEKKEDETGEKKSDLSTCLLLSPKREVAKEEGGEEGEKNEEEEEKFQEMRNEEESEEKEKIAALNYNRREVHEEDKDKEKRKGEEEEENAMMYTRSFSFSSSASSSSDRLLDDKGKKVKIRKNSTPSTDLLHSYLPGDTKTSPLSSFSSSSSVLSSPIQANLAIHPHPHHRLPLSSPPPFLSVDSTNATLSRQEGRSLQEVAIERLRGNRRLTSVSRRHLATLRGVSDFLSSAIELVSIVESMAVNQLATVIEHRRRRSACMTCGMIGREQGEEEERQRREEQFSGRGQERMMNGIRPPSSSRYSSRDTDREREETIKKNQGKKKEEETVEEREGCLYGDDGERRKEEEEIIAMDENGISQKRGKKNYERNEREGWGLKEEMKKISLSSSYLDGKAEREVIHEERDEKEEKINRKEEERVERGVKKEEKEENIRLSSSSKEEAPMYSEVEGERRENVDNNPEDMSVSSSSTPRLIKKDKEEDSSSRLSSNSFQRRVSPTITPGVTTPRDRMKEEETCVGCLRHLHYPCSSLPSSPSSFFRYTLTQLRNLLSQTRYLLHEERYCIKRLKEEEKKICLSMARLHDLQAYHIHASQQVNTRGEVRSPDEDEEKKISIEKLSLISSSFFSSSSPPQCHYYDAPSVTYQMSSSLLSSSLGRRRDELTRDEDKRKGFSTERKRVEEKEMKKKENLTKVNSQNEEEEERNRSGRYEDLHRTSVRVRHEEERDDRRRRKEIEELSNISGHPPSSSHSSSPRERPSSSFSPSSSFFTRDGYSQRHDRSRDRCILERRSGEKDYLRRDRMDGDLLSSSLCDRVMNELEKKRRTRKDRGGEEEVDMNEEDRYLLDALHDEEFVDPLTLGGSSFLDQTDRPEDEEDEDTSDEEISDRESLSKEEAKSDDNDEEEQQSNSTPSDLQQELSLQTRKKLPLNDTSSSRHRHTPSPVDTVSRKLLRRKKSHQPRRRHEKLLNEESMKVKPLWFTFINSFFNSVPPPFSTSQKQS
ncbi:hypothetical protein CSUI_008787 [Cystoisospora suis]|uniref:Uncharacterized protein n=1 Tax=Cystoisospora suis TaxID=483139 RepID=A0A2C6KLM3_9APIC|nr:hypothetical protein CSUI_008787 [Cystoisospora suis]